MINLDWGVDYELPDEENGVYIWIGNHCVAINRNDEGTSVDIYERGFEDRDPLATTYALDADCEGDTEE